MADKNRLARRTRGARELATVSVVPVGPDDLAFTPISSRNEKEQTSNLLNQMPDDARYTNRSSRTHGVSSIAFKHCRHPQAIVFSGQVKHIQHKHLPAFGFERRKHCKNVSVAVWHCKIKNSKNRGMCLSYLSFVFIEIGS